MTDRNVHRDAAGDYLETLKQVQKQYQQYLEVAELYKLPYQKQPKKPSYAAPSVEQPLTVNSFRFK